MIYASPPNWLIIYFFVYQALLCVLCNFQLLLVWKMATVFTVHLLWFSIERCPPTSSMNASSHFFLKVQMHLLSRSISTPGALARLLWVRPWAFAIVVVWQKVGYYSTDLRYNTGL